MQGFVWPVCVFFCIPYLCGLGFSIFVGVEWNMTTWELLLIAVGLSMDAFAVSICKGLSSSQASIRHCTAAGLYFGGFQMLMPVFGLCAGPPVSIDDHML